MEQPIKINDVINLDIKRMGINGEGIGYFERLAIFVDHVLPGEQVEALITKVYHNRAEAKLIKIIKESENRVEPFCPLYPDSCCSQTQHINYDVMLVEKRDILIRALDRYLKRYSKEIVKDTIGMENPLYYRNKASLPIKKVAGASRFGMYKRGTNEFSPIDGCDVQHPLIDKVFNSIVKLLDKHNIEPYDYKTKTGFLTHAVVRVSDELDEIQVSLIVNDRIPNIRDLVYDLIQENPLIKSIYETINNEHESTSFVTDNNYLVYGCETINEKLDEFSFSLKPDVFFHLNANQAHKFYSEILKLANLSGTEIVVDTYSGIAPISHYLHSDAKKIYAIEKNPEIASLARDTLRKNEIFNVDVIEENLNEAIKTHEINNIDLMIVDPPRAGLDYETIETIYKVKPLKIIYGSCNPSTLAKDLNRLAHLYEIKEIIPFDMLPFTSLVESISLLILK